MGKGSRKGDMSLLFKTASLFSSDAKPKHLPWKGLRDLGSSQLPTLWSHLLPPFKQFLVVTEASQTTFLPVMAASLFILQHTNPVLVSETLHFVPSSVPPNFTALIPRLLQPLPQSLLMTAL